MDARHVQITFVWDLGGGVDVNVTFSDKPTLRMLDMMARYVALHREAILGDVPIHPKISFDPPGKIG